MQAVEKKTLTSSPRPVIVDSSIADSSIDRYYSNKKLFFRNLVFLVISFTAAQVAMQVRLVLAPLHLADVGLSTSIIGTIMAIAQCTTAVAVILVSHISDNTQLKWGRRLPYTAGSLIVLSIACVIYPRTTNVFFLVPLFFVIDSSLDVQNSTYPYLKLDISPKQYLGRVLAFATLALGAGMAIFQKVVMPVADMHGKTAAYDLAVCLFILGVVPALIFLKEPPVRMKNPKKLAFGRILKVGFSLRRNYLLFLGFSGLTTIQMASPYVFALQAKTNLGFDYTTVGKIMLFYSVGVVAFSLAGGWIVDKFGAACCLILSVPFSLLAPFLFFIAKGQTISICGMIAAVFAVSLSGPASLVFITSNVEKSVLATFLGCNAFIRALTLAAIWFFVGQIATFFNEQWAYGHLIILIAVSLSYPLFFIADRIQKKMPVVLSPDILQDNK